MAQSIAGMGDSTTGGDPLTPAACTKCGAGRELVRNGRRTAARCDACGSVEEVAIVCAPREKWTLVDPDGTPHTFASRAELLASAAPPPSTRATRARTWGSNDHSNDHSNDQEVPRESDGTIVSLRDVVVVPALPSDSRIPPVVTSPPPPLPKGRLKTLPPPARHDAPPPPPPTIDVDDIAAKSAPPPRAEAAAAKDETRQSPRRAVAGTDAKGAAASKVPKKEGAPPQRGWLLPASAVALVVGAVVFALRSSPPSDPVPAGRMESATATASAPERASATTTAASAAASAPAAPSDSTPAAASAREAPRPGETTEAGAKTGATTTSAAEGRAASDAQLPIGKLLTRATAARRNGDVVRARTLLERALVVSPGNVEAHAGLGDLARAGGDLAGAKASYERALATSPSYGPALLNLADAEWDLGDHATAQRHYRALVQSASSPPERAKVRATGGAAPAAAPIETAAAPIKVLTSSDVPPPVPPQSKPPDTP